MTNPIARLLKMFWYALTNHAQEHAECPTNKDRLLEDLNTVQGSYANHIQGIQADIQFCKQAMGRSIALIEKKKNILRCVTIEINELRLSRADANSNLKNTTILLRQSGISDKDMEQHPNYISCHTSYMEFDSIIEIKHARLPKIEQEIEDAHDSFESHKLQITILRRDLENVKTKNEVVTDLIEAHRKEMNVETFSGINLIDFSAELTRTSENKQNATKRVS